MNKRSRLRAVGSELGDADGGGSLVHRAGDGSDSCGRRGRRSGRRSRGGSSSSRKSARTISDGQSGGLGNGVGDLVESESGGLRNKGRVRGNIDGCGSRRIISQQMHCVGKS